MSKIKSKYAVFLRDVVASGFLGILLFASCVTSYDHQSELRKNTDLKLVNNNTIALEIEKDGFDEKTSRLLQEVWFCSRWEWSCSERLSKTSIEMQEALFNRLVKDGSK
ncbi:hypothetical protein [Helicobacter zhangjianzhongii]|uniref:hypothetical protein n=1 Tax=Helicobacter zhangjianzhongii TaxID=2974574 RepID=UPI0025572867|nr:hypothetical protein [Helicobacter sp. CPD2-1]MDL0079151.1 hypothetical protein [Helicobacter sp. CPD2-1]